MEYLEENKIITISLGNKVKDKIKSKFNRDIEEFIEKEFPQDEELKIFIFKHKSKDKNNRDNRDNKITTNGPLKVLHSHKIPRNIKSGSDNCNTLQKINFKILFLKSQENTENKKRESNCTKSQK